MSASAPATALAPTSTSIVPPFCRTIRATWASVLADLFGHYRPERHYMRGPGPACRAKQAATAVVVVLRPEPIPRAVPVRIDLAA